MAIDTEVAPAPARKAPAPATVRTDIQGLRAIAVSSVLVYHLWPKGVPGGFTGVDIFFVISGFLITSHLLAHPPSKPRNLFEFWSRRIRRLLPASLLVLFATIVASRVVAPDTQWAGTASEVHAAALYFVNWRLAAQSVDYLAQGDAPSPVQHFWSLSVEEQFYLAWPILILLLVLLARQLRVRLLPTVLVGLLAATAVSLWYSVHETDFNPAAAYFVTPTRVWELGIGGVVAALLSSRALGRHRESDAVPLPAPLRTLLVWGGFAAIAYTLATYTGATPFPGYQALLPVLGTAAVIAGVAPMTKLSPGPILALRPIQWLGDISYSVYLWHWPLIVLVPYVSGNHLGILDKTTIIAVSLVLASLTKRHVEDRFRGSAWGRPLFKPYLLGAVLMAVVVGAAGLQLVEVHHRQTKSADRLAADLAKPGKCFGAAALAVPHGSCTPTTSGTLTPDPVAAADDKSKAYSGDGTTSDCFSYLPSFPVKTCSFGDKSSDVNVALIGNSHAGQWLPAVNRIAEQKHWRVTTYFASQCALSDVKQQFATPAYTQSCSNWVRKATQQVAAKKFDLVVLTNRISVSAAGVAGLPASLPLYQHGYENVLRSLHAARERIVVLRDTPAPGISIPDCLAAHSDDYTKCAGARSNWVPDEPALAAVSALHSPRVTSIDLIDHICGPRTCPAAIGGVPVYFDESHLTATYATTLAPYLANRLTAALSD